MATPINNKELDYLNEINIAWGKNVKGFKGLDVNARNIVIADLAFFAIQSQETARNQTSELDAKILDDYRDTPEYKQILELVQKALGTSPDAQKSVSGMNTGSSSLEISPQHSSPPETTILPQGSVNLDKKEMQSDRLSKREKKIAKREKKRAKREEEIQQLFGKYEKSEILTEKESLRLTKFACKKVDTLLKLSSQKPLTEIENNEFEKLVEFCMNRIQTSTDSPKEQALLKKYVERWKGELDSNKENDQAQANDPLTESPFDEEENELKKAFWHTNQNISFTRPTLNELGEKYDPIPDKHKHPIKHLENNPSEPATRLERTNRSLKKVSFATEVAIGTVPKTAWRERRRSPDLFPTHHN